MEIKTSKFWSMKTITVVVLGLVTAYTGKDLINGETLATIDNIIAGGVGAGTLAMAFLLPLIQNYLPKAQGVQLFNQITPMLNEHLATIIQEYNEIKNDVQEIKALLQAQEEQRQAILNENNEA